MMTLPAPSSSDNHFSNVEYDRATAQCHWNVHGASDRYAAYPATEPTQPADLAATIYHQLGIDPHHEIRDRFGRPMALCEGNVIRAIVGAS